MIEISDLIKDYSRIFRVLSNPLRLRIFIELYRNRDGIHFSTFKKNYNVDELLAYHLRVLRKAELVEIQTVENPTTRDDRYHHITYKGITIFETLGLNRLFKD